MDNQFEAFISEFSSDVAALVYSDGEGANYEEKFTEYCLEVLENIGETEGTQNCMYIHPNSQGGIDWKINAYCLRDESKNEKKEIIFETIDIFVSIFDAQNYNYTISKEEFNKIINQFKRFLNGALKGHIDYIDPSQKELNEFIKILSKHTDDIDRINLFILTNGKCNHHVEELNIKGVEEIGIYCQIWDASRFYKLYHSKSKREPIEIDFNEFSDGEYNGIECLLAPVIDDNYQCFLAIMPGKVLSKLYKEYSSRLLESNVRAFLQQNGKINKGIRDTIKDKERNPMFLPYNNGLSATAESVITSKLDGKNFITSITDFQIVNGGQTTASLFHTEKKFKADLTNIFVQMKLTVIKDVEKKNIEVPNISRFANSQNKISELDLSSNNPFFVKIEELSRKKYVTNRENNSQQVLWYFERVTGQYKESLNKLSISQQKAFKEKNPPSNKIVKSDIAKYINLWELEPYFVSQGSQKNFIQYTKKINDLVKKGKLPGENFYKKLIANAILFNTVDKLFGRKNIDAIGDTNLKSFTIAYTISYFNYLTDNRLDLWKIYTQQILDKEIEILLKDLLVFVYDNLIESSKNTLFSEYAKKESSWNSLKSINYKIEIKDYVNSFVDKDINLDREIEVENDDTNDEILIVSKVHELGLKFWDGLIQFSKVNTLLNDIEYDIWNLFSLLKEEKNLNAASIRVARKIYKLIEDNILDPLEVSKLSKIKDDITFNYLSIYERMSVITKQEWNKIFDLGEQTKLFNNLELANIKSISKGILGRERVKESGLKKAHDSLSKLKKFGIKY
jgi:hypothetical protein